MRSDDAGHLADDELAGVVEHGIRDGSRASAHLQTCDACRRRRAELTNLRAMLRGTRSYEQAPRFDSVPGALKRLRLRRHAVTNLNEFFDSVYALMRGFAQLLAAGEPGDPRTRTANEDDARG